jgi:diguanylate cyclase (GGDEF)-like protein/PAS domain S-box-containing protein
LTVTRRRVSEWVVVGVALSLAAGAAWLIEDLQSHADRRRQSQLVLSDIERLAQELRFVELQVRSGWGVEIEPGELAPVLYALDRELIELERLDDHGDVSSGVREAVERYGSDFEVYLRRVAKDGESADTVRRWARERTGPSFERVVEAVARAGLYFSARTTRALHRANVGSKATLAVEAFLIVVLVLVVRRVRREEERHLAAERARNEARFRSLVQYSSDAIEVIDRSGAVVYASDSVERILGRPREISLGHSIFASVHPDDQELARVSFAEALESPHEVTRTELRVQRTDGHWIWIEVSAANLLSDPNVEGIVVNFRDVSDRKSLEDELRRMALHDSLTGLPNRRLFLDLLSRTLSEGLRHRTPVTVCYLDLDGFKTVNDTLGHQAGDQLLIWVAEHLRTVLRGEDVGARLGGDELAILLRGVNEGAGEIVARRLLRAVSAPIRLEGRTVSVGMSVGIAVAQRGEMEAEELLRRADAAMYAAKFEGRGGIRVYEEGMGPRGKGRRQLRRQPLLALAGGRTS